MNSKPLFSIIVPIYNVEKYLPECLDSILNQTYKEDYEVILINDGSTDNSLNIINNYKKKFKDCLVISRENRGLLYTRVEGVKKSSGEYILFLDSDDYLPKNTLEIYQNQIKVYDYDIIRGNYAKVINGKVENNLDFKNEDIINYDNFFEKYYQILLTSTIFNNVWRQVIKKDIINVEEINTSVSMGEDIEFNQSCYKNANKIRIIPSVLYYYRKNNNSMTKDFSINRLEKNINDLNMVYDTILRNLRKYQNNMLLKLGYSSYLKLMNYYCYMLIDNSKDKVKINIIVDSIIKDKKTTDARVKLKYRDIPFKKTRFLLYLLMNGKKNLYILILRILSTLKVKYNH